MGLRGEFAPLYCNRDRYHPRCYSTCVFGNQHNARYVLPVFMDGILDACFRKLISTNQYVDPHKRERNGVLWMHVPMCGVFSRFGIGTTRQAAAPKGIGWVEQY